MHSEDDVLSYYDWQPGRCFRHPGFGSVDTTLIRVIRPRSGPAREVRACRLCVVDMETQQRRAAERAGREYKPGLLRH